MHFIISLACHLVNDMTYKMRDSILCTNQSILMVEEKDIRQFFPSFFSKPLHNALKPKLQAQWIFWIMVICGLSLDINSPNIIITIGYTIHTFEMFELNRNFPLVVLRLAMLYFGTCHTWV